MQRSLNNLSEEKIRPWVYAFILFHMALWTLTPTIVRLCLPMDALEGTTWGAQLEWGYDKNPFMNAWLTALAIKISHSHDWALYFFSQLSVAICFWSVWKLGKKITNPLYAFIAILLLATTQYYNLHAIDFNDNTLELGLWGLVTLFFYQALQENKIVDWLLTGFFAGLSMMTKYFVVILFVPMLLMMLLFPQTRAQFKKPGVYLALFICFIISAPHFIWLFSHDFITINYALNRVSTENPSWFNHLFYPVQFIWQQFEVLIPAVVLLSLLWLGKGSAAQTSKPSLSRFNKTFLFVVGVGPILTTVLLSAVTGIKLRAGWGQPLLTFVSLFLLVWLTPPITTSRFKRFVSFSVVTVIGIAIGYSIAIIRADAPSSANFPGRLIAAQLEHEWHTQFKTPLKYVVGTRWFSGNIAFYSKDKPTVFIDADKQLSPWVKENKLRKQGALFVWDPSESIQMKIEDIKRRYPNLGPIKIMHVRWLRNLKMEPIEIHVAMLPPELPE